MTFQHKTTNCKGKVEPVKFTKNGKKHGNMVQCKKCLTVGYKENEK